MRRARLRRVTVYLEGIEIRDEGWIETRNVMDGFPTHIEPSCRLCRAHPPDRAHGSELLQSYVLNASRARYGSKDRWRFEVNANRGTAKATSPSPELYRPPEPLRWCRACEYSACFASDCVRCGRLFSRRCGGFGHSLSRASDRRRRSYVYSSRTCLDADA